MSFIMGQPAKTRVSRISIDRLYNLGSYEHLKLSVTVDIPDGEDASAAFLAVSKILSDLNPKKGKVDQYFLKQAKQFLAANEDEQARMASVIPAEWNPVVRQEKVAKAEELLAKHEAYQDRRFKAALALSNLGGVSEHHDAKRDWDDEDDYR